MCLMTTVFAEVGAKFLDIAHAGTYFLSVRLTNAHAVISRRYAMIHPYALPENHPVAQILADVLDAACISLQPVIIDLDSSSTSSPQPDHYLIDSQSNDQVTIVEQFSTPMASSFPVLEMEDSALPHNVVIDDSVKVIDDDDDDVVLPTTSVPAVTCTESFDDDDDIQIVSTALVKPSASLAAVSEPINLDDDSEDIAITTVKPALSRLPLPAGSNAQSTASSSSQPEIVVCNLVNDSPPVEARRKPTICSGCAGKVVEDRTPLSRCKHILCDVCFLCSVGCPAPTSLKQNEAKNCKSAAIIELNGMALRPLPVCIVLRCGAPLSRLEVFTALSTQHAHDAYKPQYHCFQMWYNAPVEPTSEFGPAHITFPPFEPQVPASSITVDTLSTPDALAEANSPDYLLNDDLNVAYSPLWIWDEEFSHDSGRGAWLCMVCGNYELSVVRSRSSSPNNTPPPEHDGKIDERDSTVPDPPVFPHCAYARALGIVESLKGLTDVRDGKAGKKKRRVYKTSPMTTRKRFKTADSIRSAKRQKTGFAKGTGYAGKSGSEWRGTSSKLLAEKALLDQALTYWLLRVRCFLLMVEETPLSSWPGFMLVLLRERRIVAHLSAILITESIMDVQDRVPVFVAALRVVHALCNSPSLRELVTEPNDGDEGKTIAELVESLSRQAAFLSTGAGPDGLSKHTEILIKQVRWCIRSIYRYKLHKVTRQTTGADENTVGPDVVEKDGNVVNIEKGALKVDDAKNNGEQNSLGEVSTEDLFTADKAAYMEQMKSHQFQTVMGLSKHSSFHDEAMKLQAVSLPTGKRQRRIAGEVASLFASLPLSWSSTILLRVDEDRYDFLRAVIFGPEGTPYDSGAFIFDIWLPLQYPDSPPKFRLLTTGAGRVRFNPNLYNNGKVCLSLLGTWSGPSWTPASTILQVLVSIQSLILVSDPYFNEPGFERHMGTTVGDQQSSRYNERVREECAFYAIQSNIRHPSFDLHDGLMTHFRLKRRYIKHVFEKWFPLAVISPQTVEVSNNGTGTAESNGVNVSVDPSFQFVQTNSTENEALNAATMAAMAVSAVNENTSSYQFSSLLNPLIPSPPLPQPLMLSNSMAGMPPHAHTAFSIFAPGRTYRNNSMSASNLESIVKDLDYIEEKRRDH